MRPNRLRLRGVAAWLGLVALGFNALVPVHLAFDLAHALAPRQHHAADNHDLVRCFLSVLIGHQDDDDQLPAGKGRHDHGCAVCGVINTLAGFALPSPVPVVAPALVYVPARGPVDLAAARAASLTAYRSRAPPVA